MQNFEKKNDLEIWRKGTSPPNLAVICLTSSEKTGFTDGRRKNFDFMRHADIQPSRDDEVMPMVSKTHAFSLYLMLNDSPQFLSLCFFNQVFSKYLKWKYHTFHLKYFCKWQLLCGLPQGTMMVVLTRQSIFGNAHAKKEYTFLIHTYRPHGLLYRRD